MAYIEPLDLSEARSRSIIDRFRIGGIFAADRSADDMRALSLLGNLRAMGWEDSDSKRSLSSESTLKELSGATGWGGFKGAKLGGLTMDWSTASRSIDQDLQVDLRKLRAGARNQALNSPIASKFLAMTRSNVIGQHGMKLAFKVAQVRKSKKGSGLDDNANAELSRGWNAWGEKGSCTVCGRYSRRQLQRLVVENWARDGEQFLRKVYVPKSVNPFGFQLQLIDADQVDDSYNVMDMPNGNQVRMGVEVDANQKPVAYHIFNGKPYEGYV